MERPPYLDRSPSRSSNNNGRRNPLKRSHSKMSEASSRHERSPTSATMRRASSLPRSPYNMTHPERPQRASDYPGGGMDFRRPVTSSSHNVIDLTGSDDADPEIPAYTASNENPERRYRSTARISRRPRRMPRYSREIIDLDNNEPDLVEETHSQPLPRRSRRSSPEVEILFSRPRAAPLPARNQPSTRQSVSNNAQGYSADDSFVLESNYRGPTLPPLVPMAQRTPAHLGYMQRIARHMGLSGLVRPMMDYTEAAFDLGMNSIPSSPRVSPPGYEDIPAAREGFTRTPKDGDILVCPHCGDELCTGDTDIKKQVWVVKSCGHVYCGECANHRHASKKGKARAATAATEISKPFATCVVEGCSSPVKSKTSMIQIFL